MQTSNQHPKTPSSRWIQLGLLLAAGSLSSAAGSMVAPVFPEVFVALSVNPLWSGMLVSIHTLTIALATPILGLAANRVGHRQILITSLITYGLFGVLGAWATSFWMMFACRALVGAASGGIAAVSIGVLSGFYEGEARTRMMGYATSALASATVLFPILGGWAGSVHWQYAFYLHGIALPVAIAALVGLKLPESLTALNADLSNKSLILKILGKTPVLACFLSLALASALFYVVVVFAPQYLKTALGAPPLINGFVLATRAIGAAIISAFGASKIAKVLGAQRAIAFGFLLMALSLMSIPLAQSPVMIIVSALPFGLGFGIVMPNLYSRLSNFAPTAQQTALLGIGTGISSLGQFLSPAAFGPIWVAGGELVFYVAGGLGLLVCALMNLKWGKFQ